MDGIGSILTLTIQWADEIGSYALALVAVGALSMALLEALKGLFKLKAVYHEYSLKKWLCSELSEYLDPERVSGINDTLASALPVNELAEMGTREVIALATGVPLDRIKPTRTLKFFSAINAERSLYTLSLDKMMGQLQESVEIVLDNPNLYQSAFLLLTGTAHDDDVRKWMNYRDADYQPEQQPQEIARVGNRIQQTVQRQLDTYQLRTEYRWARLNQMASFFIGAIVLFLAIYFSCSKCAADNMPDIAMMILLSVLGGFTAPISKDLVTNLSKVKVRE